jgi:AAA15 family ATPase/GTPase
MSNEIKGLRGYRAKAKVVKARLRNEIKDLQQELATSRDYSDKQADVIRHYVNNNAELDKAATNLQHFRRFSND